MQLYTGNSSDFVATTATTAMATRLTESFERQFRRRPPESEVRSWQNSLSRFARVLEMAGCDDQGVIVEYQLPLTSKRLDVMVTGTDHAGDASAVVVELKQWDAVAPSSIEDCVETFLGGRQRPVLHPSRQAGDYAQYLRDTHTAFADGDIGVKACGYLHNMARTAADVLFDEKFEEIVRTNPTFVSDDTVDLAGYLDARVGRGDDGSVLDRVVHGRYRPHRLLMQHVADVIDDATPFVLLDEQRVACNDIVTRVRARQMSDERSVVIVKGGPGTGKSLIAVHLLAELARYGFTGVHATGSKAFTETMRKRMGRRGGQLFRYFNNFVDADEMGVDLLIADEAHRIRKSSNNRFTRKDKRSELPQVTELMRAAKVSVFFIDDMQVVRPGEEGSTALIRQAATELGAHVTEHELEAQFRCSGSDAFIDWVDNTLGLRRTSQVLWDSEDPFDLDIVDSVDELEALIRARNGDGDTARLVAGYCWPWSDPTDDGTLVADVQIGGWSMPWNAKPDARRLAPGIPKSHFWAADPDGIDQVGCVYTAQGFEFEHVGVIWGRDLVYRGRDGWVAQPEYSKDTVVRRSAKSNPEQFAALIKQTYRVLLTRGMQSCTIYFEDRQTEEFILSRIER